MRNDESTQHLTQMSRPLELRADRHAQFAKDEHNRRSRQCYYERPRVARKVGATNTLMHRRDGVRKQCMERARMAGDDGSVTPNTSDNESTCTSATKKDSAKSCISKALRVNPAGSQRLCAPRRKRASAAPSRCDKHKRRPLSRPTSRFEVLRRLLLRSAKQARNASQRTGENPAKAHMHDLIVDRCLH